MTEEQKQVFKILLQYLLEKADPGHEGSDDWLSFAEVRLVRAEIEKL